MYIQSTVSFVVDVSLLSQHIPGFSDNPFKYSSRGPKLWGSSKEVEVMFYDNYGFYLDVGKDWCKLLEDQQPGWWHLPSGAAVALMLYGMVSSLEETHFAWLPPLTLYFI